MTDEDRMKRELEPIARQLCKTKDWELGAFLGAGTTAATFEASAVEGLCALKIYSPRFLTGKRGEQVKRRFEIVVDQLRDHHCPHLITVYQGAEFNNTLYMLMQRAPGKCLAKVLKSIPAGNIREIVRQIATAAKFLEGRGLCHRDIKSDNIVITEDFSNAVLLDLGVVRWLDEEGVGTDQGGQLPFIATAQYSSPEYMFRLTSSGPDLWRGLTFYQLGGLIHDLIMKERLFEDVVQRATENRYLIAYAVATRIPSIMHDGSVPLDLVLLAQRALEKEITKRLASVEWTDFLGGDSTRQDEIILGLRSGKTRSLAPTRTVVPTWIRSLEIELDAKLAQSGIHCGHSYKIRSADCAILELSWSPSIEVLPAESKIIVRIELNEQIANVIVAISSELQIGQSIASTFGPSPVVTLAAQVGEQYSPMLVEQCRDRFTVASAQVVRNYISQHSAS